MDWMFPWAAAPSVIVTALVPWFDIKQSVSCKHARWPWYLLAAATAILLCLAVYLLLPTSWARGGFLMVPGFAVLPAVISIIGIGNSQALWRADEDTVETKNKRVWLPLFLAIPVLAGPFSMFCLWWWNPLWPFLSWFFWLLGPVSAGLYFYRRRKSCR